MARLRGLLVGALVLVLLAAAVAAWVTFLPPPEPEEDAVAAGRWVTMPSAGLTARSESSVVWTRKAMIVWGGEAGSGVRGDGASFDLATQTWTPLPPAPVAPRHRHSVVWTGTTMLVYGGQGLSIDCPQVCALGDGAAFDTIANTWKPLAPAPLAARSGHTAVWVQNRMVVWGGAAEDGGALGDGASYDPSTNSWTPLPAAPFAARVGHGAVATTQDVLVWGGASQVANGAYFSDGAVFSPIANEWKLMAAAPESFAGRDSFASVWTGDRMLVWGGAGRGDGATYNLAADSWTSMGPSPLTGRTGAGVGWTGRDMLVWGGFDGAVRADGALYDPTEDSWSRLLLGPLPPRQHQAMVWTGRQLLVWGGEGADGKLADGAVLTIDAR